MNPGALVNTVWYAAHPFAVTAPAASTAIPTEILDEVEDPVVTQIEVLDAPVFISLDGTPVSPTSYDYKLEPIPAGSIRYPFFVDPALIRICSVGGVALYKIGYESNITPRYSVFKAFHKEFTAAPTSATPIPLSLVTNADAVFITILQVEGSGALYVTLDDREPTNTDYDYKLTDTGTQRPEDALELLVAPDKIKILGEGGITYKLGFAEYEVLDTGSWTQNPLYDRRGFR